MKFDDSEFENGWVGLYEEDEDFVLEETRSFRTVVQAEKYIQDLRRALREYKKNQEPK